MVIRTVSFISLSLLIYCCVSRVLCLLLKIYCIHLICCWLLFPYFYWCLSFFGNISMYCCSLVCMCVCCYLLHEVLLLLIYSVHCNFKYCDGIFFFLSFWWLLWYLEWTNYWKRKEITKTRCGVWWCNGLVTLLPLALMRCLIGNDDGWDLVQIRNVGSTIQITVIQDNSILSQGYD